MPIVRVEEGIRLGEIAEIWAIRSKAIQGYANLEQALCRVFSLCSGAELEVAGIIFFRISAHNARNAILDRLIKHKYGPSYSLFWNSILDTMLRPIDNMRNQIVHWNAVNNLGTDADGNTTADIRLYPPYYSTMSVIPATMFDGAGAIGEPEIKQFSEKVNFLQLVISMFYFINKGPIDLDEARLRAWREIFLQPVTYPPQSTHPALPNWQAPATPPLPSQG